MPRALPRRSRLLVLAAAAATAGAGAAAVWLSGSRPAPPADGGDELRSSPPASPFRNTRPGVGYVGDAACGVCHAAIAESYRGHPMGRDLAPVAGPLPGERLDATAGNPFEKFGFTFRVEDRGGTVVHRVTGPGVGAEAAVAFALGSGTRGRSFVVHRDGFLTQSPVSWFADPKVWDLSPGFTRAHLGGLPVEAGCLFCHAHQADPVPGTVNRYRDPPASFAAVGCERCHGPGRLHVEHHTAGGAAASPDETIVNPKHLPADLREDVCAQCHYTSTFRSPRRGRGVFDYRPGLPLDDYWALFTRPPALAENHRHGNRVEQMHASRCFQGSDGKLGCTSCHDPHRVPAAAEAVGFYRGRCLSCHQEKGCSVPAATRRQQVPTDSCAACHMPKVGSGKAVHVSDTDHRIVRRPDPPAPRGPLTVGPGDDLLVPFSPRERQGSPPPDAGRDLGLALAKIAEDTPALRGHAGRQAMPLLESAVRRHPDDAPVWQAKARILRLVGRPDRAVDDLRSGLLAAPDHEALLADAGATAKEAGDWAAAREFWAKAAAVNPYSAGHRERLAEALYHQWEWGGAVREAREALRLDPTRTDARVVLASALIRTGDRAGAKAEFDALLALRPPNPDELRAWFAGQMK